MYPRSGYFLVFINLILKFEFNSFLGMCQNGICMNTIGSFHCECYPGYVYDEASHQCIDKNECVEDNPCQGNAKCINTPGAFECSCPDGYKLEYSGRSCKDINECLERGHTICQVD